MDQRRRLLEHVAVLCRGINTIRYVPSLLASLTLITPSPLLASLTLITPSPRSLGAWLRTNVHADASPPHSHPTHSHPVTQPLTLIRSLNPSLTLTLSPHSLSPPQSTPLTRALNSHPLTPPRPTPLHPVPLTLTPSLNPSLSPPMASHSIGIISTFSIMCVVSI